MEGKWKNKTLSKSIFQKAYSKHLERSKKSRAVVQVNKSFQLKAKRWK